MTFFRIRTFLYFWLILNSVNNSAENFTSNIVMFLLLLLFNRRPMPGLTSRAMRLQKVTRIADDSSRLPFSYNFFRTLALASTLFVYKLKTFFLLNFSKPFLEELKEERSRNLTFPRWLKNIDPIPRYKCPNMT